ncbi:sodium:galactoside symporter [Thioclava dalianensis]|uniref:Sodium:galactoside symporter n=1 Tax=Thioclava dalianensis TaxID=1185766 RepID=A0A074TB10_9RHOB|nr:MFS transporter [Thioclava dalianensis]KEP68976.1 sodium:galactoside symporter [Thioclava dalianensis]SFN73297.1 Na+/melibiose symporter [Thioclava dalianensis]
MSAEGSHDYWRVGGLAMVLATASIPIYIHLPSFAATRLGLSLSEIGAILLLIRIIDFLQDPLLGWMTDRWSRLRAVFAAVAMITLGLGCLAVFTVPPVGSTALWLALGLIVTFSGYSLGTILLYGQSAAFAGSGQTSAQLRLASWRETGVLIGVLLGAIAPTALGKLEGQPEGYAPFGILIAVLAVAALLFARPLWHKPQTAALRLNWSGLIGSGAGWLLLLAFVNSLPVAVTSTLFLFFVGDRLGLPDLAGPFLILFFLSAGIGAPLWGRLARRFGARPVLTLSMSLAIVSFIGAFATPPGAALPFAAICIGSGIALGADMVILSALFAAALERAGLQAGQAFGFWNFSAKATLAIAAGVMLPLLQYAGFQPGAENTPRALEALNISYALVPCALKLIAIAFVLRLPSKAFAPAQ